MRIISSIFLALLLFFPSLAGAAEENTLYQKLIDGSPWLFTTKYEKTQISFRLTQDGKFQRQASDGSWNDMTATDSGVTYKTINGHQITIQLSDNGTPIAIHSKHASTFTSLKQ